MAQFYAYDFIYDNIPSQKFGLKIISFEDGGLFNGVGSSDVEIISQTVLRKSKPYYLGRTQTKVLEFPLTFGTAYPISGFERDSISAWLFGRSTYKKLYIMQDDLNQAYFNCFFTQPEPLYIGNINYAFTCNVVCDSPWAYGVEHSISGSIVAVAPNQDDKSFTIYNGSSEDEYLYPNIHFKISEIGGTWETTWVAIKNYTTAETCTFTQMEEGYNTYLDNDLQMLSIYNIYGQRVSQALTHFNKRWFRLIPGVNECGVMLQHVGDILESFDLVWTERMKIGG